MFPGTGPAIFGFYFWATWEPGTKAPGVVISKNGRRINKPTAGKGGAKANKKGRRN